MFYDTFLTLALNIAFDQPPINAFHGHQSAIDKNIHIRERNDAHNLNILYDVIHRATKNEAISVIFWFSIMNNV